MSFAKMREKAKFTMAEAAEKLGVTPAAVCQWEHGQTMPKASKLAEIARTYNCTIDELISED